MRGQARKPRIAVVLPVYNGEKYVAEAINSVLGQTFTDFELVVIDDGSSDRTPDIVTGFRDGRVRLIRFLEHRGLVAALNTGIQESKSELIARMDADDICLPSRLERQISFLDAHSEVAICGTWIREFGDSHYLHAFPVESEQICARMFAGWAMAHPTLMMRRGFLQEHDLKYCDEFLWVEDLDLLLRASQFTKLANVPEVLLRYRVHQHQVGFAHGQAQDLGTERMSIRQLRQLVPDATKQEEDFHLALARGEVDAGKLPRAEKWLLRLDRANIQQGQYDQRCFRRELHEWWHTAHLRSSSAGLSILVSYWRSPLASFGDLGFRSQARLIAYCLRRQ